MNTNRELQTSAVFRPAIASNTPFSSLKNKIQAIIFPK